MLRHLIRFEQNALSLLMLWQNYRISAQKSELRQLVRPDMT